MFFSQLRARPAKLTTTGNIVFGCCLLVWFIQPLKVQAGIDCNLYVLSEFQRLCKKYPAEQRHVHNDIPDNDLNKLRNRWGSGAGLHILPPGQYALSTYLSLDSGQTILPNPLTILPRGKPRTIELVAGSHYTNDTDDFFVLRLTPGSRAGGIEIHARNFHELQSSNDKNKTLVAMASGNTELSGSFLEGDQNYTLNQLALIDLQPGTEEQPVLFERNLLDASGSMAGVFASLDNNQQLTVRNSMVHTREPESVGLQINGGVAEIFTSDIDIDPQCENCRGIRFRNNRLLSLVRTAFWAKENGTAIDINFPYGANGFEHGLFRFNAFSSKLDILSFDSPETVLLLTGTEFYSEALARGYPEESVADFFSYTGERGVATMGSQFVDSGCLFNQTDSARDSLCFQNNTELNRKDFNLYYPPTVPEFPCHPKNCIDPNAVVNYFMLTEAITAGIVSIITIILCYCAGKRSGNRGGGGGPQPHLLFDSNKPSLNDPI